MEIFFLKLWNWCWICVSVDLDPSFFFRVSSDSFFHRQMRRRSQMPVQMSLFWIVKKSGTQKVPEIWSRYRKRRIWIVWSRFGVPARSEATWRDSASLKGCCASTKTPRWLPEIDDQSIISIKQVAKMEKFFIFYLPEKANSRADLGWFSTYEIEICNGALNVRRSWNRLRIRCIWKDDFPETIFLNWKHQRFLLAYAFWSNRLLLIA